MCFSPALSEIHFFTLIGGCLGFFGVGCWDVLGLVFEKLDSPYRLVKEFSTGFPLTSLFLEKASTLLSIAKSSHGIITVIDFVNVQVVRGRSSLSLLLI